jgi:hypothetical protein
MIEHLLIKDSLDLSFQEDMDSWSFDPVLQPARLKDLSSKFDFRISKSSSKSSFP